MTAAAAAVGAVAARRARARAWCRVDLAGGTLDIWPLGLLGPSADARTINTAIDLPVEVEIRSRPAGYEVRQGDERQGAEDLAGLASDPATRLIGVIAETLELPPARFEIASASPRGAGLGASSALAVALIAAAEAWLGRPESSAHERAALVRDLEARMMRLPTGVQDQYPTMLGGVVAVRHLPGGTQVERLAVDLQALRQRLVIAYSGQSHISADSNWQVVRRALDGDADTLRRLAAIADTARRLEAALVASNWQAVGTLLGEEHRSRRGLAAGVSTPKIDALLAAASGAGSFGGKVCGAGGGGCVAVFGPPEKRPAISAALAAAGGEVLDAGPIGTALDVTVVVD